MVADVNGSGWSIAGLDVKKFPETSEAARFVRAKLNAGVLEPASQAEWDEVHDDELARELLSQNPHYEQDASGWQEARIQRAAAKGRARIEQSRRDADGDEDEYEDASYADTRERRQAVLDEQDDMELGTDDPEVQVNRTTGQRPRKASSSSKKKAKSKSE
jgi:hypothetical protein